MILFTALNQCYVSQAHTRVNADAIHRIKTDTRIWRVFLTTEETHMGSYMRKLFVLTNLSPLPLRFRNSWTGSLVDIYDWQGLMWLWYAVRCMVSHGSTRSEYRHLETIVVYAYDSLLLYMTYVLKYCDTFSLPQPHSTSLRIKKDHI